MNRPKEVNDALRFLRDNGHNTGLYIYNLSVLQNYIYKLEEKITADEIDDGK